jgi:hypothetical protein
VERHKEETIVMLPDEFVLVKYSHFFQKRHMLASTLPKIPSIGKRDKLQRVVFTSVECSSCHAKTKQAFKEGDYIVKEIGKCEKCGGPKVIALIYSEQSAGPK